MAEAQAAPALVGGLTATDQRHWVLRRIHSLSGIIPIGGFLLFHLFENSYVMHGGAAWWRETEFTRTLPYQVVIEAVVLWIPLLYHGIYGLVITFGSQPNAAEYSYPRNLQYTLQRITGVLAFLFIGFHVISTRIWYYATGIVVDYARMHAFMMNPVIFAIYVVGVLACVYHLTNGIFTFCITWGITVGPRAQTLVNRACVALFVILAIVGMVALVSFRAPI